MTNNVKKIRICLKLTQEQLAKKLGCCNVTISGWENDKHSPCVKFIKKLIKMASKNGIQIDYDCF